MSEKKDDPRQQRVEATAKREPEVAPATPEAEEAEPKKTPWARLLTNLAHSGPASKENEVQKRLRANDINTYQDAANNPNVVINILRDVYGADFGRLMEAAKEHEDATNR